MTIKCGRPGTGMPAFDKFAYTDGRCYGMKQADLKSKMADPPATFQQREIDLVADFLMLRVVGKGPMDRAKCIEYWGSDVEACREFRSSADFRSAVTAGLKASLTYCPISPQFNAKTNR